ncbi:hypothetical protein OROGR_006638 [Orobanche gracilis]
MDICEKWWKNSYLSAIILGSFRIMNTNLAMICWHLPRFSIVIKQRDGRTKTEVF